jgi:hypothetical protein
MDAGVVSGAGRDRGSRQWRVAICVVIAPRRLLSIAVVALPGI